MFDSLKIVMGDFNCPSFYVEHGTAVFNVSDRDLHQFIKTVENIESSGYAGDKGIYKVGKSSRDEGSKPEELLKILKPYLEKKCVLQELRKYPLCDSSLGYRSIVYEKSYKKTFYKEMKDVDVYSVPSCCSQILMGAGGNAKAVVDHWFEEAKSFCVHTRSVRSAHMRHNEDERKKLVENGLLLKAEYERLISVSNSSTEHRRDKETHKHCSCVDCFVNSDEEEEEEDGTEKPESQPTDQSKSVLSKLPRYAAGIEVKQDQRVIRVTKNCSLSNIMSVLDLLPKVYRGLQMSYFYVGQTHSCFAAHTEDASLYSANYLHLGLPKIWVTVSTKFCDKVRDALKNLKMDLNHTSCVNSLNHKFYVFTLSFLDDLNVPYHITAQYEGEMVILEPDTLHFGFNCGPHIAEAVNFGTIKWIPEGVKAMKWRCRCFGDESIHLDMSALVAAFYPEMLKSLYECPDWNKVDVKGGHVLKGEEKLGKERSVKVYECPHPNCASAYRDHKKRLIQHVDAQHKDSAEELLQQIEDLYPTKASGSSNGLICQVCNVLVCGSSTHLEKHYGSQIRSKKLSEDVKARYSKALEELQASIPRRKKAVKIIDNEA